MKTSYYFQHDYNASSDIKILMMRQQLGMEGYGIFWFLIEALALAGGRLPVSVIPILAAQMQTTADKVAAVVKNYDLFVVEDEKFFSIRLLNQITHRESISMKRKKAATTRWIPALPHGKKFSAAWSEWMEHRKQIKKPLTDVAIKKQLQMLSQKSEDEAVAIINQSIQNGWQGLFELQKGKNNLDINSELINIYTQNR
ncbi:MAG: hypothetical protein KatS3mg031_2973 [Chitinophagales bacterium]|nr:MAG: hypothetical protein KatS3mg031_2973 [Chitinophagales bacterium]